MVSPASLYRSLLTSYYLLLLTYHLLLARATHYSLRKYYPAHQRSVDHLPRTTQLQLDARKALLITYYLLPTTSGLQLNSTLEKLYLADNSIGPEGQRPLGVAEYRALSIK